MGVILTLLWILFIGSSLLLCAIILLQEGKGGGLAEAFGGVGAEAFGVKAGGVTKVTAVLAAIFLGSAIMVASCHRPTVFQVAAPAEPAAEEPLSPFTSSEAPADDGAGGASPAPAGEESGEGG